MGTLDLFWQAKPLEANLPHAPPAHFANFSLRTPGTAEKWTAFPDRVQENGAQGAGNLTEDPKS